MRGRKPKSTAQQIAEGDPRKRGKHKLQEAQLAEPDAPRGLPPCPLHLQGRARSAWKFWAEQLAVMNLDCRPDAMMLEGACSNYAGAILAEIQLRREGQTIRRSYVTKTGETITLSVEAHPAVQIARQRWTLVKGFCSEFGLSPVSRTRLSMVKPNDGSEDLAKLLMMPRQQKTA